MSSLFSARRKPKRIASSEPRDDASPLQQDAENDNDNEGERVVRRPDTAPKQKSKLRISFDPGAAAEDDNAPAVATKRGVSGLSKTAGSILPPRQDREDRDIDRPSYSKSYLDELKGSTPSTPKDPSQYNSSAEDELAVIQPQTQALDIASKFGTPSASITSAIPSAAEIAEKKERRNRLAKEQQASALTTTARNNGSVKNQDDFISLDAYDSDGEFKPSRMQVSTHLQHDRTAADQEYTRLVPEDEDMAEGFDTFVDDNPIPPPGTKQSNRLNMTTTLNPARERNHIKHLIDNAEGAGASEDSDSSASSASDRSSASASHAYMTSQTRHGAAFSHLSRDERRRQEKEATRPKQPAKITPIPTLAAGLARLKELQDAADMNRQRAERRKLEILRRLKDVEAEKVRIQGALEELGRQLQGVNAEQSHGQNGSGRRGDGERGLENIAA